MIDVTVASVCLIVLTSLFLLAGVVVSIELPRSATNRSRRRELQRRPFALIRLRNIPVAQAVGAPKVIAGVEERVIRSVR